MIKKLFKWLGYIPIEQYTKSLKEIEKLLKQLRTTVDENNNLHVLVRNQQLDIARTPIILHENRRCGNTTRLADWYIQLLFKNGRVKISDHYSNRDNYASLLLLRTVVNRLNREHQFVEIRVTKNKYTIELTDNARNQKAANPNQA
jgi:hypothetical protein